MKRSVIIAVIVAVIVIVAGVFAISRQAQSPSSSPSPTSIVQTSPSPSNESSPSPSISPEASAGEGTTTEVTASGFSSSPIHVKSGQKLTFTNKSGSLIQVDSDPHPAHTDNPELNVGEIADGASRSVTPIRKGTFGIHNHLNPSEHGTVVVE